MTENDFYVKIQYILEEALDAGFDHEKIYDWGLEAIEEWAEESGMFEDD